MVRAPAHPRLTACCRWARPCALAQYDIVTPRASPGSRSTPPRSSSGVDGVRVAAATGDQQTAEGRLGVQREI
ncbi:hypothetical protein ACRAWD_21930 [Caulobacter segnis]